MVSLAFLACISRMLANNSGSEFKSKPTGAARIEEQKCKLLPVCVLCRVVSCRPIRPQVATSICSPASIRSVCPAAFKLG